VIGVAALGYALWRNGQHKKKIDSLTAEMHQVSALVQNPTPAGPLSGLYGSPWGHTPVQSPTVAYKPYRPFDGSDSAEAHSVTGSGPHSGPSSTGKPEVEIHELSA